MAVTVKKAILWRREVDNSPGMLASVLQPLSESAFLGFTSPDIEDPLGPGVERCLAYAGDRPARWLETCCFGVRSLS
jgi:hypothetical protein